MRRKKAKIFLLIMVIISFFPILMGIYFNIYIPILIFIGIEFLALSFYNYKKRIELIQTQEELKEQNKKLELSNKYKTEFLANMSHELRTPLNSILLLAKDLTLNKEKNLSQGQIESAQIIESAGKDLLLLINDILDLTKIEVGKLKIHQEEVVLEDLIFKIQRLFAPLINKKNLSFHVQKDKSVPDKITGDSLRIGQILTNLLGNAVKFTDSGSLSLNIFIPENRKGFMAFSIKDTGIGIPESKFKDIFEAFYQFDGSSTRKHGGTGLGLSLSLALAKIMGGDIEVKSHLGKGSEFTLYLPLSLWTQTSPADVGINLPDKNVNSDNQVSAKNDLQIRENLDDDDGHIRDHEKVILIIEEDKDFSRNLILYFRSKGMKVLHALDGDKGMELVRNRKIDAVYLHSKIPKMSAYQILESIKSDFKLRHIPICVMSKEENYQNALCMGAYSFLRKPVSKEKLDESFFKLERFFKKTMKELLIIESSEKEQKKFQEILSHENLSLIFSSDPKEALKEILKRDKENPFDAIMFDYHDVAMNGDTFLRLLHDECLFIPPLIIIKQKSLSMLEEMSIRRYKGYILFKDSCFELNILDLSAFVLHLNLSSFPENKLALIKKRTSSFRIFENKKILILDDDVRSIYAISRLFSPYNAELIKSDNPLKALEILEKRGDIDLIIVDLFMPEIDGHEFIRRVRSLSSYAKAPILVCSGAKDSKEYIKSLESGANDYLTKPIDSDQMLFIARMWLQGGHFL